MAKLNPLELWSLADSLSVVNAAILIAGGDPSAHANDHNDERVQLTWQHDGYDAVYSALRAAILSNKLKASVRHSMRTGVTRHSGDGVYEAYPFDEGEQVTYDMLIARAEKNDYGGSSLPGQTMLNFSPNEIRHERFLYILREPNWGETTVDVEHLKDWLESRGVFPSFFFPGGERGSFRNPSNPRYSAKLACAIAAWEAVEQAAPNKSVKQSLHDWIQSNGVRFGLGESGVVSATVAEEVAKIANWNTRGGANPTPTQDSAVKNVSEGPTENYQFGYPMHEDDESDIPF